MAIKYRKMVGGFWTGTTGKQLRKAGTDVQLIALYLVTGPQANMIGLYDIGLPIMAYHTGWDYDRLNTALMGCAECGFAFYDQKTEYVWVPEMAKWQVGSPLKPDDKKVTGIHRLLESMSPNPFTKRFCEKYGDGFHIPKPLTRGLNKKTKPLVKKNEASRAVEQKSSRAEEKKRKKEKKNGVSGKPGNKNGKLKPKRAEDVPIPKELDKPSFRVAWKEWLRWRREERRLAVTVTGAGLQLDELKVWGVGPAIKAMEVSIKQGWQGLFEPRTGGGNARRGEVGQTGKATGI